MQRRAASLLLLTTLGCASAPPGPPAVSEQSARQVLTPSRLGWLSSEESSATLPTAIALGGRSSGRLLVYFEFPELDASRPLSRAELLVVTDGAPGDAIEVELSRSEPAGVALDSWSQQPQALYPRKNMRLEAAATPARLDVTEMARTRSKAGEPLRLLLRAEPGRGAPVLLRTGADGAVAPRLEAYWD